jgi:hypothetical protein
VRGGRLREKRQFDLLFVSEGRILRCRLIFDLTPDVAADANQAEASTEVAKIMQLLGIAHAIMIEWRLISRFFVMASISYLKGSLEIDSTEEL